ncbi:putative phage abortive infection protein [Pseudomonas sp. fls2-241-R2A-110]|uniref:putative phage abortive infection protein n=1 Tax=Pseudomonas sp. fls2-241-R2A-110 TaxID=3040311 RepID=UPI0025562531|nr:putative phage abortive infection protein [Pseudomonas sp. fls2-241-R2A-110]
MNFRSYHNIFFVSDALEPDSPPSLRISRVLLACFGAIALIVLIYASVLVYEAWPIGEYSISKAGTFGDSFGALNCLFTGLGFAGLLITIFLQREDLKLTRAELSETRVEIKLQSRTFRQQQFEESFYRLLLLYRNNLADLSIRPLNTGQPRLHGIDALNSRLQDFEQACIKRLSSFPSSGSELDKDDYTYWLYKNCNVHFPRQARYLESLNSIISLVRDDCYDQERQENYLKIFSSQFTIYEIKYIFYQALLNPNYESIRSVLSLSQSFKDRFSISSIPAGHYQAMEHLWHISLSQRNPNDDRLFYREDFQAARTREAQRRQKEKRKGRP